MSNKVFEQIDKLRVNRPDEYKRLLLHMGTFLSRLVKREKLDKEKLKSYSESELLDMFLDMYTWRNTLTEYALYEFCSDFLKNRLPKTYVKWHLGKHDGVAPKNITEAEVNKYWIND